MRILLVRHGRTEWNDERRIQGRTDVPLSPAGEAEVAARRIPSDCAGWGWHASPLARARRTAELLGAGAPRLDDRLREMSYGDWEGLTRAEIRARDAGRLAREEARGVDYRPPGGESPREVQARFAEWADAIAGAGDAVAVTHKGVITAALALASEWDLARDAPWPIRWECAHLLARDRRGRLRIERLNVGLDGAPLPP